MRCADASRHDPEGTHQLIRIGDITEDRSLIPGEPNLIKFHADTAHRSGEVLLVARGNRMTSAVFEGTYLIAPT